jgi:hypothetical protein
VDFLFLEILSAPTVDSMKIVEEEQSALRKAIGRVSMAGTKLGANVMATGRRLSNAIAALPAATQHKQHNQHFTRISRLIPAATNDAHIMALASSEQVLQSAQRENEQMRSIRKTHSYRLTVQKQRSMRRQKKGRSDDASLENLFTELCVDIAEQRKFLPPEVNEDFDDLWG